MGIWEWETQLQGPEMRLITTKILENLRRNYELSAKIFNNFHEIHRKTQIKRNLTQGQTDNLNRPTYTKTTQLVI